MKSTLVILTKIFVREFYRVHAGNFLVVLGFVAGFMRAPDHIALGESFIQSPFLLCIPIVIWLIYAFVILDFNARTSQRNENQFLIHFILFLPKQQWVYTFVTGSLQLIPALLYGTFLAGLSIRHQHYHIFALILVSLATLLLILSWQMRYHLLHPSPEKKVSRLKRWINKNIIRPPFLFQLEWVSRNQPLAFIGAKIAGWFILWATLAIYPTDDYDVRLLGLGLTIAFAANLNVLIEWHRFENFYFSLTRQMPISIINRIFNMILSLVIFCLPEAGLLFTKFPITLNFSDGILAYGYALSIPVLLYSFLFVKDRTPDKVVSYAFFFGIIWIIAVLSNISLGIICLVNISVSLYWWKKYYYRFEYVSIN
ncbi:MAG TPA: hypothetical protein VD884_10470 [Ohtaekwangia sp.]|nr:hypothetical protein [Ohtaekwangia sp.]